MQSGLICASSILSAARGLRERGWWAGDNALAGNLLKALRTEITELIEHERLALAGIGRDVSHQIDPDIRRDRVYWLRPFRPVQRMFLDRMESLRLGLNRELLLGLFEFEGHFAHYPPGAFYRRHYDSLAGAANRIVSVIVYLNEEWKSGDGGELVLYEPGSENVLAEIAPKAGTMVLLMSEEIPHEVRTSRTDRLSITGWFRLNTSTGTIVDPPR